VDKVAQERVLDEVAAAHPDLVVSRVRPALIFQDDAGAEITRYFLGPLVPTALLRAGRLPVLPLPTGLRLQVVHADDVAQAISRILETRLPGPVNLAAPDILGAQEITDPLGGRPGRLPSPFLLRVTDALWAAHLWPLDAGWLRMAAEVPLIDSGRARRELGWQPEHSGADAWRELVEAMAQGLGGETPATRPRTLRDDLIRLVTSGPVTRRTHT
jgi:nucleoside-diphosphate-sugar epimerase